MLDLVAAGQDNARSPRRCTLSVRTVERHLQTVYRKLELTGSAQRTAAAALVLGVDDYARAATAGGSSHQEVTRRRRVAASVRAPYRREHTRRHEEHRHDRSPTTRPRPTARSRPSTARCGRSATTPPWPRDLIADLGPVLVEASGVGPGERVLDVAAGSGNAASPRPRPARTVVATDLTPELFDDRPQGRRRARASSSTGEQADAEALPYADGDVRRRAVLRRRHVRPAPPGRRRRAGPGLPPGRHHRPAQLDARRASSGRCSPP